MNSRFLKRTLATLALAAAALLAAPAMAQAVGEGYPADDSYQACLLYTSDAADDLLCVDLGGRRLLKKKNTTNTQTPKLVNQT